MESIFEALENKLAETQRERDKWKAEAETVKLQIEALEFALHHERDSLAQSLARAEESARRADVYIHACERAEAAEALVAALERQVDRLQHGNEIESDYITKRELELQAKLDELKNELEIRDAREGILGNNITDANTLADELASSLKDVLTLFAGGQKNEHTVKHARSILEYYERVRKGTKA